MEHNYTILEFDDFIEKIIESYKNEVVGVNKNKRTNKQNTTIPIFVGAGISASANVPLDFKLQKDLNDELSIIYKDPSKSEKQYRGCNYTKVYKKIEDWLKITYVGYKNSNQYTSSLLKNKLRDLMNSCGIPREKDECLPNRSNIILIRLLLANFFGPIISINIDSLLMKSLKTYYLDSFHRVQFIANISQFSDLLHEENKSSVIFQPHGTIEEPLSLRFTQDELMDKEDVINLAISRSLSNSQNVICVGLGFNDDTIKGILKKWSTGLENRYLNLFISEFGDTISDGVKNLIERLSNNVSIYIVTSCNSDNLLLSLSKKLRIETKKSRGSGLSDIHIHPDIQTVLLNQLCSRDMESNSISFTRIMTYNKILLTLVNSKEPVLKEILIKQLYLGQEASALSKSNYLKTIQSVIVELKNNKLIREVIFSDGIFYEINESFDLQISQNSFSIENYITDRGVSKEDFDELIAEDFRRYDPSRAIEYYTNFSNPNVIETHKEMDRYLDSLKEDLASKIKYNHNNSIFICGIITEHGRHLLKDGNTPRDWFSDIIRSNSDCLKMQIVLASDLGNSSLSEVSKDESISNTLESFISNNESIEIINIPWEKHSNHMWFYLEVKQNPSDLILNGNMKISEEDVLSVGGLYFPIIPGDTTFSGIKLTNKKDVLSLYRIFCEEIEMSKVQSYVLALTLVDGSTLEDDSISQNSKIFVGLRGEKYHDSHVNVLSVPTKRIPKVVFNEILRKNDLTVIGSRPVSTYRSKSNGKHRGDDLLTDTIDSLLSQRMLLGSKICAGEISFTPIPSVVMEGIPEKLTENDHSDYLKMINVLVIVDKGQKHFINNDGVYEKKAWIKVSDFVSAVENGNYIDVNDSKHQYICGGLCVCSAKKVLTND